MRNVPFSGSRGLAAIAAMAGAALVLIVAWPFVAHPGEAVIVAMAPAMGLWLWLGWPAVRRISPHKYVLYVVAVSPLVAAAAWFAASMAQGRVIWVEVFWGLYFLAGWRLAWAVWKRTVGRLGQRWWRWGRWARHRAGGLSRIGVARVRRRAAATLFIPPARALLSMTVFAPLFLGSLLIHRLKVGNADPAVVFPDRSLEAVTFTTDDGLRLSGWFLAEEGSDATVVICHGAGANKGNFATFLHLFAEEGYNALIFDFRGHGESDGHTLTFGLYESRDVKAAVDWLRSERPAAARHIYGLGSSMGAMALVRAAADDPRIAAVILDSCFASAPLLAEQRLGNGIAGRTIRTLVLAAMSLHAGRSFETLDARPALERVAPRPVLLIHGDADRMIPPANLSILYEAAGTPKMKWLGPGPHSNVLTEDFHAYQQRVLAFLKAVRARPENGAIPPARPGDSRDEPYGRGAGP